MKKGILLTFVAATTVGLIALLPLQNSHANIALPPAGYTGAPGESTCATAGCHSDAITTNNDPTISITGLGNLASGYTPGTQYNFSVNAGSSAVYGFELTTLDASNNAAGTLALTGGSSATTLQTLNGRQYIGHKLANSSNSWTFKWTAPASGDVYFYLAVNNGNGDNTNQGDLIRTRAYKLTTTAGLADYSHTVGISEVKSADDAGIKVYPNPVKDQLNLSFAASQNENVKADIYDLNGQLVMPMMDEQGSGHTTKSFGMNNQLSNGIYIIRMTIGNNSYFKKIMVQQ